LLRREFYESGPRSIVLPRDYLQRHGIRLDAAASRLRSFETLRICVVGDLIVDEYITCQALGMSQEDPSIVVTPIDSTRFVGGAGIVAAHGAGLGAAVDFVSVTGADETRDLAQTGLTNAGVRACLLIDESRPTTLKQRFRSKGKTLLRVSHLHQNAISAGLQAKVVDQLVAIIERIDLLVFSDFNYGCLPQAMVEKIVAIAKPKGVVLAADSQSSSQIGDISRFRGMQLITPTEHEARISTRNREDGLVILAEQIRRQSLADNVLLKIGEEGLLVQAGNGGLTPTDRIGGLNASPKDVAGAGDSLLVASALTLAAGGDIWEAAFLGSLAAAVQVGRVGNTPLRTKELLQELA
jgi:rfaE bifunctional protein kinase chain/domain